MNTQLNCSVGQYSSRGLKASNQDSHGVVVPNEPHLTTKGIAVAIADGISSSDVSHIASQTSVKSFLEDYYCTSETWSVKNSAERVVLAHNSWLFAQNHRNHELRLNKDKGYVCTFSALVFKSNTAYLFHIGDAQISRIRNARTEILTEPHRLNISATKSYLSRALGTTQKLEIDCKELSLDVGDIFLLMTDGVYEALSMQEVSDIIGLSTSDLNLAAQRLVEAAIKNGSEDNLTAQVVRIESLPSGQPNEFLQRLNNLPFPPSLQARMNFDGYEIIRDLHKSSRSHVLLAYDKQTSQKVVIKSPSTEGRQDSNYVERFLMEEWIANRLKNAHILKSYQIERKRNYHYLLSEYVEGITLAQWIIDNQKPTLDRVRNVIGQAAKGLQAFHRQEMLHQDLRPENIMIDTSGTVKIIDFGSTYVSGIAETHTFIEPQIMPGTAQFLAPEYFVGEFGTKRSDIYSLACITYHMLGGKSPYGAALVRASSRAAQRKLVYQSLLKENPQLPVWFDLTLKKALHVDPQKRYAELSEFIQDLAKPNAKFISQSKPPLLDREPLRFWQGLSAILAVIVIYLLTRLS